MNQPNELDRAEAKLVGRTFASWKLDLIKALVSDRALQPSDVRVAVALVQHLNAGSFSAFPSQETIAAITCMSTRNVRDCLDRLRQAEWLHWDRGNRQKANEYEFDEQKIANEVARMKRDEESRRRSRMAKRSTHSERNHSSGQKQVPTGSAVPLQTGSAVPPNTYREQRVPTAPPRKKVAK